MIGIWHACELSATANQSEWDSVGRTLPAPCLSPPVPFCHPDIRRCEITSRDERRNAYIPSHGHPLLMPSTFLLLSLPYVDRSCSIPAPQHSLPASPSDCEGSCGSANDSDTRPNYYCRSYFEAFKLATRKDFQRWVWSRRCYGSSFVPLSSSLYLTSYQ